MKLNQYTWDPQADKKGEGSFAEVFEAKDNHNDLVALKIYRESVIQSSTSGSLNAKYSLENEFSKGKHLSHTNVIRYIGIDYIVHTNFMGQQVSYPVLIMEYADGGSLETRIQSVYPSAANAGITTETLGPEEITTIAKQIFEGLAYLNDQGIIHRDLKPANILFKTDRTNEKVVKITDFGISRDNLEKNITGLTTTGIGTISYMAPEQFLPKTYGLNGTISNRTDIWAVGIILYRMVTGLLPFNSQEDITGREPDYSKVPVKYRAVIKECLQKNAANRFVNARAALNALGEQPVIERVPWLVKNKKAVIRVALAVIAVAVLTGATFYFNRSRSEYVVNQTLQLTDTAKGESLSYTYTGWLTNGIPNGQGTKLFKNGNKYTGESKNGLAEGNGKLYYKVDGGFDSFEGQFKDGKPNGTGTYTYKDGSKYIGQFKDGDKNGQGTLYFNGDDEYKSNKYIGSFAKGSFEGNGTYYWNDGKVYSGEWKNGLEDGQGTLTLANGNKYVCQWEKGIRNGKGIFYSNADDQFKGDHYEGDFLENNFSGYGKYYWHDSRLYDGYFKNGKQNGQGTMTYTDGSKYIGDWVDGDRTGYGKTYDAAGNVTGSGYFINGVLKN